MDAISSSILGPVCERVIDAAIAEYRLVRGVKEEIRKLHTTVSMIKGVLEDAERKKVGNDAIHIWLKSLKQVLFDAEDVFDEIATDDEVLGRRRRRRDADDGTTKSAVITKQLSKLTEEDIDVPQKLMLIKHINIPRMADGGLRQLWWKPSPRSYDSLLTDQPPPFLPKATASFSCHLPASIPLLLLAAPNLVLYPPSLSKSYPFAPLRSFPTSRPLPLSIDSVSLPPTFSVPSILQPLLALVFPSPSTQTLLFNFPRTFYSLGVSVSSMCFIQPGLPLLLQKRSVALLYPSRSQLDLNDSISSSCLALLCTYMMLWPVFYWCLLDHSKCLRCLFHVGLSYCGRFRLCFTFILGLHLPFWESTPRPCIMY